MGCRLSRESSGDVIRTYVGRYSEGLKELSVPGSVSTEGWNINQDTSVVGYYDTADGKRHGFVANPIETNVAPTFDNTTFNYIYETIEVPGVDFLAVTASSDFGDYAGYTKSADGGKDIAFTLIDGVFETYDFPGSENTYFYALGNNEDAAGYYEDSNGLHRGIVLENGELRQYDFPGSVETEIWGISDSTGALTGNFVDAAGVRRGFTHDQIVEVPDAIETYADFVSPDGFMVGSYIDAEGVYYPYLRSTQGRFLPFNVPDAATFEYYFVHGTTDGRVHLIRWKKIGDIPRTYVGTFTKGRHEVQVPGSVKTEGYNINADLSVVGHYETPDGRIHSFVAKLAGADTEPPVESTPAGNVYTVSLSKGLNIISVPLAPPEPMTAKGLVKLTGATTAITLDATTQRFMAWTPEASDDGFAIEGGKGYIVNVREARAVDFTGTAWTHQTQDTAAAPILATRTLQKTWAFVVSGHLSGTPAFAGNCQVIVRNLRTNSTITAAVQDDYFAAVTADLTRRSVVEVGDVIELRVIGPTGNAELHPLSFKVTPEDLANAVLSVKLDGIGQPMQNLLLQNYPNPFNPETWIPYQLSEDSPVSISIYDTTGQLVRTLSLGFQSAGFYNSREHAAYWDGRNALGERVASGIYFYQLTMPSFQQTRRLVIVK